MSKTFKGIIAQSKVKAAAVGTTVAILAIGGGAAVRFNEESQANRIESAQEATPEADKNYTILVYMIGSDLESNEDEPEEGAGEASADLQEMVEAMKNADLDAHVNVVVGIGGSKAWKSPELAGIQNARLTIDSKGIHVKENMTDINMGESRSVTNFINYAYKAYPAEQYYMVLWNHGNGPTDGYGSDVLHDGDSLTLDELHQALANADFHDFTLIGFDACCMGSIETANILYGYTDYVVASPACEDAAGWDYSWIEGLSGESVSGRQVGTEIVQTYSGYYESLDTRNKTVTLSCYDMSKYEELLNHIHKFGTKLLAEADTEFYYQLSSARNQIAGYYSGGGLNESMELLDLKQLFCTLDCEMWEQSGIAECLDAWICCAAGTSINHCGVSIFLPDSKGFKLAEDMYHYMNCGFDDSYIKFVYSYAKTLDQELELNLKDIRADYDEKTMTIRFQADQELFDQIAAAYLITAYPYDNADGYYLLSTDSDVTFSDEGVLACTLDVKYFTVAGQVLCLIESCNSNQSTQYLSPIVYNDKFCLMTIEVSLEYPDGRIVSIMPYEEEKGTGKEQYELKEGDSFCALYPIITENSETLLRIDRTDGMYQAEETVILQEDDCVLNLQDIQFEQCSYGLMLKDKGLRVHYSDLYEYNTLQ